MRHRLQYYVGQQWHYVPGPDGTPYETSNPRELSPFVVMDTKIPFRVLKVCYVVTYADGTSEERDRSPLLRREDGSLMPNAVALYQGVVKVTYQEAEWTPDGDGPEYKTVHERDMWPDNR